ncbi:hypothetical protein L3Q82_011499, partial [Scortum barcoo]
VPFGLASAPSAFQKIMSTILAGLPGVQAYLDDIICYGVNQQDHDANLRRVLHALNEAGLKLNMQKCKFNQTSLRFLGHTISKDGLHPDQDRVSAVADAPAPHDTSSLRSFLGLASWYKFTAACDTCPELTQLRRQIQAGWPQCKKNVAPELTPYFNVQDELAVDNSLVMRGTDRVVVPTSLRSRVVGLAHEGHQGIYNDKSAKTAPAPLTPVKLPDGLWEKVAIDIMGPFENATWDCCYIIALTDYYSKWPEVAFASTVTTENTKDHYVYVARISVATGAPPWSKRLVAGSARNGDVGPPSSRLTTRRKVHEGPV